jgi:hypothetical protein
MLMPRQRIANSVVRGGRMMVSPWCMRGRVSWALHQMATYACAEKSILLSGTLYE